MSKGGGAWKVAYADFVTAMMALFMVLWISSQDKEVLIATSRYFQQPFNSPLNASAGILNLDGKQISESSSRPKSRDEKGEGGRPPPTPRKSTFSSSTRSPRTFTGCCTWTRIWRTGRSTSR
jgi:flagellar motor protein MotB